MSSYPAHIGPYRLISGSFLGDFRTIDWAFIEQSLGRCWATRSHNRILALIPEEGVTDLRTLGLNERQIEALRLMVNERQKLTNRQYREIFGITDRTALRDFTGLIAVGYAQRVGEGPSAYYIAT
ncbi:MAG: hypothetical protein FJ014_18925 [Chloroflexi bacterium]|nr:hypothetical protein [Chloroflexota bacterium]